MKKKLRQIVIGGKTYLWKYTLGYKDVHIGDPPRSWPRHALFTAYQFGVKNSPLYIFVNWDDPLIGNPSDTDVFLDMSDINADGASLYVMPERAAKLIRLALDNGWQPEQSRKPFRRIVFSEPYTLVMLGPHYPVA